MSRHVARFKWKQFGRDLRNERESRDIGLRECARARKIHHATWCRAEAGKPLTVPIFLFLCEWMGSHPQAYAYRRATETPSTRAQKGEPT